jgi:hypothetical protein
MNTFSVEKAVVIRYPSTANLMVDSADRDEARNPTPWDFQITRSQSIFNGYFSRIGATEVVFDWCLDNISPALGNTDFTINDSSGVNHTVSLDPRVGTVAQVLAELVELLNALALPVYDFEVVNQNGFIFLGSGGTRDFAVVPTPLSNQLNFEDYNTQEILQKILCPDLRPFKYLDITCSDLTYPQDLKDSSTQDINRDVIVRWYFSDDVPEQLDPLGFPILMGYTRFSRRRIYNPPKQIKWDNNLPVGNLRFQVYDQQGNLVTLTDDDTQWRLTLQLSEN